MSNQFNRQKTRQTDELHNLHHEIVIGRLPEPASVKEFFILWNNFLQQNDKRKCKVLVEASEDDATLLVLAFLQAKKEQILASEEMVQNFQIHCLNLHSYNYLTLDGLYECLAALKSEGAKQVQQNQ